jgi:hypothetical protein
MASMNTNMNSNNYSLYRTGTPESIGVEMLRLGVNGIDPTPLCVLALFSNRENWRHTRLDDGSHRWTWVGPNIPPWEVAERVFAAQFDELGRSKVAA